MIETGMVRPFWEDKPMHEDITVLICQNKTYDLIRLSLESLLTFYPTIKILVVNGSPTDQSGKWLRYKEAQHDNLTVWDRTGYDSHGVAMHEAIMGHVTTKYVLLLDSDVIIKRAGVIELMRNAMPGVFASGMLMNVTRKNHACGWPDGPDDVLRYIHPSTGMYDVDIYKSMKSQFTDHGAPCVYPLIEAEEKGLMVIGLPVGDYIMHMSGASWTVPRTVWEWDNGVCMRPLVTFITHADIRQSDNDYDIIRPYRGEAQSVIVHDGREGKTVDNDVFSIRFNVMGDFVCACQSSPNDGVIARLRALATSSPELNEINIDGFIFYKRKYFQSQIAFK